MHTTTQPTALDVPPGLKGVVAADNRRRRRARRGGVLPLRALRRHRAGPHPHRRTRFLLVHGRLPSAAELATFRDEVAALRRLRFTLAVQAAIPTIAAVGGGALRRAPHRCRCRPPPPGCGRCSI
ncbi:MAG: hypothetical protein R2690_20835 [Acidimicrobiales bacterium]